MQTGITLFINSNATLIQIRLEPPHISAQKINATCHQSTGTAEGSAQYYNQCFKTRTRPPQQNAFSWHSPYTLRHLRHRITRLHCEKTANIWLDSTVRPYGTVFQLYLQSPPDTQKLSTHSFSLSYLNTLQNSKHVNLYRMYNLVWSIKSNVVIKLQNNTL